MTELKRGRFLKQNLETAFPHLYSVRNGWLRPSIGEEVPLPEFVRGRPGLSPGMALQSGVPSKAGLAVNLSSMTYGKNHEQSLRVIDRVNDAIISDADAIAFGMTKFLGTMGTRLQSQGQKAGLYAVANGERETRELGLSATGNGNPITHEARFVFRSERNRLSGRVGSFKRLSAIARSIKSSRRLSSWTMWTTTSSWTRRGNARKAVRNTSAVAWIVVMRLV